MHSCKIALNGCLIGKHKETYTDLSKIGYKERSRTHKT